MIKKSFKVLVLVISLIVANTYGIIVASASTGSVAVKTSSSQIIVGNNVTITATVSSTSALGSWDCTLGYDSSKFTYVSSTASGQRMVGYGDGTKRSVSYTFTFKAKSSGTATFKINAASVLDWATEKEILVSKGFTSVSVITKAQLEASYSSNNNLSSLTIDNASLSPAFDAGVISYTVELVPNTTNIKVNAAVADSKSTITGIGEISVADGSNIINIIVKAQNGQTKTYTINATVKELTPIEVNIGKDKYTVVRKKGLYEPPVNFAETSIRMGEEDVLAYVNQKIGCTVVGLKNAAGTIEMYIYDSAKKGYEKYKNITIADSNLYLKKLQDVSSIPSDYEEVLLKINEISFSAWHYNDDTKFYLMYGVNTETGDASFYLYDKEKFTIQRFYDKQVNDLKQENHKSQIIIMILSVVAGFFVITSTLLLIKILRKKNQKNTKSSIDDYLEKTTDIGEQLRKGKKKK